jgi:hypothetical protein
LKSCLSVILVCLLSAHMSYATETSPPPGEQAPIRLEKPLTISYHSHWLLIGGLRGAYRIGSAQTEINALVGTSVVTGCGIQAPKCEQGVAFNVGARRYFSESAFSAYGGANVHGIVEGIRGTAGPTAVVDLSLGFNHQTEGHFNWGLGYSALLFDGSAAGFNLSYGGWILSEFGYSF